MMRFVQNILKSRFLHYKILFICFFFQHQKFGSYFYMRFIPEYHLLKEHNNDSYSLGNLGVVGQGFPEHQANCFQSSNVC